MTSPTGSRHSPHPAGRRDTTGKVGELSPFVTPTSEFITSAKEVMSSSAFVCLSVGLRKKTTQPIFTKLGGKMAHGPGKKRLDFCGNPDHVTLGLWLG